MAHDDRDVIQASPDYCPRSIFTRFEGCVDGEKLLVKRRLWGEL